MKKVWAASLWMISLPGGLPLACSLTTAPAPATAEQTQTDASPTGTATTACRPSTGQLHFYGPEMGSWPGLRSPLGQVSELLTPDPLLRSRMQALQGQSIVVWGEPLPHWHGRERLRVWQLAPLPQP